MTTQPINQRPSRPATQPAGPPSTASGTRRRIGKPSLARRLRLSSARLVLGRSATMRPPRTWRCDDRGSAAIEAVIGVTAFGLFIAMTVAGGRVALGRQGVETAANDAARAASIARTSREASADARTAAINSLNDQDIECTTTGVQVDTSGFSAPIGTTAQVRATVSCTVKLSDLAVPGMPGSRTITETVTSPIDAFRERR